EYIFYFLCCLYFACVVCRITHSRLVGAACFLAALICPACYDGTNLRVLREFFYTGLTLLLLALAIDFLQEQPMRHGFLLGVAAGLTTALYWMSREEGIWIVPSILILLIGAFIRRAVDHRGTRLRDSIAALTFAVVAAGAITSAIGLLNLHYYGRFV